ncbi:hypothetical protein BU17DRAFT_66882 [Hysterangium stoloniferum]|nr:hypothetical protein BU17DRAFT_66882 [Hysterangium stoloniferum]
MYKEQSQEGCEEAKGEKGEDSCKEYIPSPYDTYKKKHLIYSNRKCAERATLERPGGRGASSSSLTTSAAVWHAGTLPKGSAVTTGGDVADSQYYPWKRQRNKGAN